MPSERYMKPLVDNLIEATYGKPSYIIEEFPVGYGRADIVYVFKDDPYVVSVELKINNWKRGFLQALRNLVFSKYSYLALQWKRKRNINIELLKKCGIGLIAVNGEAQVLLEPTPSKLFEINKNKIKEILRGKIE